MGEDVVNSSKLSVGDEIVDRAKDLLNRGSEAKSHQAKIVALSNLLEEVFEVEIGDILPGIEKKIGSRILGVSGRIDLLYQGLVIEMKTEWEQEYDEAVEKLEGKYFPTLLEANPDLTYVGLITDMEHFEIVRPVIEEGEVVDISTIDHIDASQKSAQDTLFWLDSALFSGKVRDPSADELLVKFGPGSPTYEVGIERLEVLWERVEQEESVQIRLDLWTRMMEIVYGGSPDTESFVAQTYLSILVKLLVRLRIDPSIPKTTEEFEEIITGEYFSNHGITNLIEDDFFTWILDNLIQEEATTICEKLAHSLSLYDLDRADEDLFKEVYQEIISLNQRHGTGEYYTPRWLCEFTLEHSLEYYGESVDKFPRLLDPACGSGGFLTAAIHEVLERAEPLSNQEKLDHVTSKVQGIDVNPLAVIIARANYAIALGDLLRTGEQLTIPVFAADSIKLPQLQVSLHNGVRCYAIEVENRSLLIPETVASDSDRRTKVLNSLGEATHHYHDSLTEDQARAFLDRSLPDSVGDNERPVLQETLKDLLQFVDEDKDHIWIYLLNNFYAPIMLTEGGEDLFDLVIGNPPWIVMRSIGNEDYQEFLKKSVMEYGLLDQEDIKLFTHMEMATLFFRIAPDLYLNGEGNGRVAFIMPVSVTTGALHHKNFNDFDNPPMKLEEVNSFRGVRDIFSLPPVVLVAELGESSKFPVGMAEWEGSLTNLPRNAPWEVIRKVLSFQDGEYSPARIPTGESPYYEDVYEGATITPRNLYYVEFVKKGGLGVDENRPLVKTSEDVARVAGKNWKEVRIEGRVESKFIFASYLGKDLIPFGTLPPRPVVLPSIVEGGDRLLLDEVALRNRGYPLMAEWLEKTEEKWAKHRTEKSDERFPSIKDRLNYHNIFTNQDPEKQFIVIYNGRGADSYATVIDREDLPAIEANGARINFSDFVTDSTNYAFETDELDEAHYLCAVLNSHEIHEAVKPFQPEGAYGYRDIGRRPFRLPIPEYDDSNGAHRNLSDLSKESHHLVDSIKFTDEGFRTRRNMTTEKLKENGLIDEINDIVLSLGMAGATFVEDE